MATLTTSGSPKAQKPCAGCDKLLNQDNYSGTQWKKGAAKQCKSCMENGAPPEWLKDAEKAKVSFYPCPTPFSPTISPQQSMNKPIVRALSLFVSLFFSFFSLSLFLIFSLSLFLSFSLSLFLSFSLSLFLSFSVFLFLSFSHFQPRPQKTRNQWNG